MAILNTAKKKFQDGEIDFVNDTIKVALLTSSHTTDIDTQEFFSDVNSNEASASGYTTGGQALSGKSSTVDNTNDDSTLDGDNVTWTVTGGLTARYVAVYKDTGDPTTSPLITIFDLGSDKTVTDGDFTVQWDSEGIVTFS